MEQRNDALLTKHEERGQHPIVEIKTEKVGKAELYI